MENATYLTVTRQISFEDQRLRYRDYFTYVFRQKTIYCASASVNFNHHNTKKNTVKVLKEIMKNNTHKL